MEADRGVRLLNSATLLLCFLSLVRAVFYTLYFVATSENWVTAGPHGAGSTSLLPWHACQRERGRDLSFSVTKLLLKHSR